MKDENLNHHIFYESCPWADIGADADLQCKTSSSRHIHPTASAKSLLKIQIT